jgi:hypothetical protein
MKRAIQIMLLVLLFSMHFATGQAPRSRFDPAPPRHAAQQKSFVDWAFSRINARNIDYGARIEEWRQGFLDDTVRDPSFRMEALLIASLCVLFLVYWWEVRTTGALRVSTTRIITAYESELAVAREQIAKLSTEYARSKRLLEEQMEVVVAAKPQKSKPVSEVPAAPGTKETAVADKNGKADEPPIGDNGSGLSQQLLEANQIIGSLRRQVGTVTKKLEEEQQKNRKLRGE